MAGKYKELAEVLKQECIAPDIYSMWLQTDKIAEQAVPGQFISVYSNDGSRLLPRPISLCEIDKDKKALRIVYRVAGKGTAEFAQCQKGDKLEILGPLGNGFPMERAEGKKVFLIGGGIGIPPMVELSRQLPGEKTVIAGYRDDKLFLKEELERNAVFYAATEDGSVGTKGNVLDAIRENKLTADVIYACGPMPMLRALKTGTGYRVLDFHGRAYGMRHRCLPCLRLPVKRGGRSFSCT